MATTSWAQRRKLIYTSIVVGVLLLIVGIQTARVLYEPPTCFDGVQNQNETGIDCGGDCQRVCTVDVGELRILSEDVFEIRDGVYTAVAQIENPNNSAGVHSLSYEFQFENTIGENLDTVQGSTFVKPNSRFPVFVGPFELPEDPAHISFRFTEEPVWVEVDKDERPSEQAIEVEDTTLLSSETNPKLRAVISNTTIRDIEDISVVALISRGASDVVAASRTVVDVLPFRGQEEIVFTWPDAFEKRQEVCEVPVGVMLAIDRSGSMNDDGEDPAQPISDVRDAARSFIDNLRSEDKAGVVSFATNAEDPPDLGLTANMSTAGQTVSSIVIRPEDEDSYTNIGDAIRVASEEIQKDPSFNTAEREFVIVLLTDGQANYPLTPGGEEYARTQAEAAKNADISLYTIGLGAGVNREFLQEIATAPNYYFEAATTDDLVGIYEEINTSVCSVGPAVIELFPRFNDVPELK